MENIQPSDVWPHSPINPPLPKPKRVEYRRCYECGGEFDCGGIHNRVYCSPRCRARHGRKVEKEKHRQSVGDTRELAVLRSIVLDPTREQLDAAALAAKAGALPGPLLFAGTMPEGWLPPLGVAWDFIPSESKNAVIPSHWQMMHKEVDAMDVLREAQRTGQQVHIKFQSDEPV